ncbi:zinc finger CCCH domain-containing protein 30 [Tanacetum coccineum]
MFSASNICLVIDGREESKPGMMNNIWRKMKGCELYTRRMEYKRNKDKMKRLTIESDDTSATLLELAANNDIDGFTKLLDHDPTSVDRVGRWYVHQKESKKIVHENRTPLMVASLYGNLDVMKKILSLSRYNVNQYTGSDQTTALHCAASCGSLNAVEAVKLLLSKRADPNLMDADSLLPMDMIFASSEFPDLKGTLQELLRTNDDISRMNQFVADIEKSLYLKDEFRIFSYKVTPCSRPYFHDMTACLFVHRGDNARRQDP